MIEWGIYGEPFWSQFANLENNYQRRQFLLYYGLQYKDIPKCGICHKVFFNCEVFKKENVDHSKYWKKHKRNLLKSNTSFEEKLKYSQELVEQIMREHEDERIYLAYSGGIDSECCVQLFKKYIIAGIVQVIWGDTLVEFPETRERIQESEREFGIKIIISRPKRGISFKYIVDNYGLPLYSRASSDKEKRVATSQCCYLLKKRPMINLTKDCNVLILGLRMEENQNRRLGISNRGDYFYSKSHKRWSVYPIAFWNEDDVWKFQELMGFHYNKIYDNTNCNKKGFYLRENGKTYHIRTGCWSCPQSINSGYLEWLERYYPKFYNVLMVNFGLKLILVKLEERKAELRKLKVKPCGEKL